MSSIIRAPLRAFLCACTALVSAQAASAASSDANPGYVETVVVTGSRLQSYAQPGATSVLSEGDLARRDIARLGDALVLLPGVSFQPGNRGGARNEASVYIRGFDLSRVPVLLDGIPIYVPYDGYIDLNRLQVFDLAGVEVARGYASVLYGPNAMGGAINLVSRRPGDGFSARGMARLDLSDDLEQSGARLHALASYGADTWFAQGSLGWLDQDFTALPGDFPGGLFQPPGERLRSFSEDLSLSLKAAWMPGDDLYALTYVRQDGEKGAPPYAENIANRATFFDWPFYDKESVYWTGVTAFANGWSLRTRAYYDAFENQLRRYDNVSYATQSLPFAFTSNYDDDTYGGSAELTVSLSDTDTLRLAAFYKQDTHREFRPGGPVSAMRDATGSIAIAYRGTVAEDFTLSAGASYDFRNALEADNPTLGGGAEFAVSDQDAVNWQAGLEYALHDDVELFAGISQKSRFATMYERYSYRLGFGQPNAALEPERLLTIEGGVRGTFTPWLSGSAGVFWGEAEDYVQSVTIGFNPNPPFNAISQFQNVGTVEIAGLELELAAEIDWFTARLSYTYLERDLTEGPAVYLFGTPESKLDADVEAALGDGFFVQANAAYRDGMLTSDTGTGNPVDSYVLAGLKAGWRSQDGLSVEAAIQNLFDELYEYDDGYPGAGRSFSLTVRAEL